MSIDSVSSRHSARGGQPVAQQRLGDGVHQRVAAELAGRDVDRHADVGGAADSRPQSGELGARLVETHAPISTIMPGVLGDRR